MSDQARELGRSSFPPRVLNTIARPQLALTGALVLFATALVLLPVTLPELLAYPVGLALLWFLPGYFVEGILLPERCELALTRLPQWLVFGLFVWAVPATALQFVNGNWFQFRLIYLVLMWVLWMASTWRRVKLAPSAEKPPKIEWHIEGLLALLGAGLALYVANGPRDADDWLYLQITQQILGSASFQLQQASEARYTLRYAFHVWLFTQAYFAEWFKIDPVVLAREILPTLIASLALIGFYGWAKTFFRNSNAALAAVAMQLVLAITFYVGDGWGRGLLARASQDKFLVWLLVVPMALGFAWQFLSEGRRALLAAYAVTVIAGLWIHPVALFLVPLSLGGFALLNLFSRASFPRARWLWLTFASLPALAAPVVIRLTTIREVFVTSSPFVEAYIRLSDGKLWIFGDWYEMDPALISHPLIILGLITLIVFAARLMRDPRVQFLWGSALVPVALLINPFTARILGEMLTPWQLWRMTWNLPCAFIFVQAGLDVIERLRLHTFRLRPSYVVALLVAVVGAFGLYEISLDRWFTNLAKDHAIEAPTREMLLTLRTTLTAPSNVLLPREMTRYAPAYTYNAVVLSNDAQKPEDARGQQIDRFYEPDADPKFLDAFLTHWEIEYAVVENESLQDDFLRQNPRADPVYRNGQLTLYRVAEQ